MAEQDRTPPRNHRDGPPPLPPAGATVVAGPPAAGTRPQAPRTAGAPLLSRSPNLSTGQGISPKPPVVAPGLATGRAAPPLKASTPPSAAVASTSLNNEAIQAIVKSAIDDALGSLRSWQRELDARVETLAREIAELQMREVRTQMPAAAPPTAFTGASTAVWGTSAPPPPMMSPPMPSQVATGMTKEWLEEPGATTATSIAPMDPSTQALLRLAREPVDSSMDHAFDGDRRRRRLARTVLFFVLVVVGGLAVLALVSQNMHGL